MTIINKEQQQELKDALRALYRDGKRVYAVVLEVTEPHRTQAKATLQEQASTVHGNLQEKVKSGLGDFHKKKCACPQGKCTCKHGSCRHGMPEDASSEPQEPMTEEKVEVTPATEGVFASVEEEPTFDAFHNEASSEDHPHL